LTPEDALQYAIEIGSALSRAHARGEVHGAISPSSVFITESGTAVLAAVRSTPDAGVAQLAAAYRAPEQIRGEAPDWRSDIFSFGALLQEMVNSVPAFRDQGAPVAVHAAMQDVIAGCLENDPARRRQRIQNAVIELKLAGRSLPRITETSQRFLAAPPISSSNVPALIPSRAVKPLRQTASADVRPVYSVTTYSHPPRHPSVARGRSARFWVVAGLSLFACAAIAAIFAFLTRSSPPVYEFSIEPGNSKYSGMPAISPDGRYLSWVATGPAGERMLFVRGLDESHARSIPNTEGAEAPFWSPNSQSIGFFANRFLKKARIVDGSPVGAPQNICPAETLAGGGSWNKNGVILFAPGLATGLWRVSANGGNPQPVTTLAETKSERSHMWPQFLPDGKHFIFYALTDMAETSGVYAGALDSPAYSRLFSSETNAVYSAVPGSWMAKHGYLLYIRDGSLTGQPFSASRLQTTGEAVTLPTRVGAVEGFSLAQISVANNGTLVYQSGGRPTRQLVWIDRSGQTISTVAEPGDWGPPRIAPDGQSVAVGKQDAATKLPVIWILDPAGHATQVSDIPRSGSVSPVWSPDGAKIAFANDQLGAFDIYVQSVAGKGKAELVYRTATAKNPEDWSRDGKWLLFRDMQPGMNSGVYGIEMSGRKASPIVDTIHSEGYASLSPDGKWLAYQSDEQGAMEVFVQSFENGAPGTKKLTAVSVNGGGLPRWRRDGSELFYASQSGRMYAVGFHAHGDDFSADPPRELFHTRPLPKTWNLYDVSADGQRFVMNVPMEWPTASEIKVTTSWIKALQN
jgi:Tol biopolymer transport system component